MDLKDKTGDIRPCGTIENFYVVFFILQSDHNSSSSVNEVSRGLQVILHACEWNDLIQSERYGNIDDQHLLITAVHNSLQKTKGKAYFP